MGGQINVEVDAKPQEDLNARMTDIREQYEMLAVKNNKELQAWFQAKVGLTNALVVIITHYIISHCILVIFNQPCVTLIFFKLFLF